MSDIIKHDFGRRKSTPIGEVLPTFLSPPPYQITIMALGSYVEVNVNHMTPTMMRQFGADLFRKADAIEPPTPGSAA